MNVSSLLDSDMRQQNYDQLLDRLGLQRKGADSHTLAAIGLFGLGMAVGVSLGVLFAPRRGEELRSQAVSKIPGMRRDLPAQERIYEQTT